MSLFFYEQQVDGLTVDSGANEKSTVLRWNNIYPAAGLDIYEVYVISKADYEPLCYVTKKNFVTIKNLAPGEYYFSVVAIDKYDDETELADWKTFTVADITPPKKGSISVTQVAGNQNALNITMSKFTDASEIKGYIIKVNGKIVTDLNNLCQDDKYVYTQNNLAGKIAVEVIAVDAYGNMSQAAKKNITIKDVTAPEKVTGVKVISANEKLTSISWDKGVDNVGVVSYEVIIDGKKYKAKNNAIDIKKLSAGNHTLKVIAYDKAKNASIPSVEEIFFVADGTDPKKGNITVNQNGNSIQISMANFTDNYDQNLAYNIWVNGKLVEKEYSGNSLQYMLGGLSGKVTVEVTAVDDNGNQSKAAKKSIKINAAAPSPSPTPTPTPTPGPGTGNKQTFGKEKFSSKYKNYTEKALCEALKKAVVSPLKTTDGDDYAEANASTFSYFQQGINFGGGNDKLVILPSKGNYEAAGAWFNGDVNFGEGNNTLESNNNGGGLLADNLYFGNGNNTIILNDSEVEIGKTVFYSDEDGFPAKGTGKIIFGDGQNNIEIGNEGELEGTLIQFGNGGNNVVLNCGCMQTESYYKENNNSGSEEWWNDIMANNGGISKITFGSGDDSITLSGKSPVNMNAGFDWDDSGILQTFELNMGGGDDKITVKSGGVVTLMSTVDSNWQQHGGNIFMGDGNDTIVLEKGGGISYHGDLDFGDGNDTLIINEGAELTARSGLYFGDGDDTLVLNGKLTISSWSFDLDALENISGKGELVIAYSSASEELVNKFESAGITVTLA